MQVIRDNPGRQMLQSSVLTIGNFDGLHLGHQCLINRCKELAGDQQGDQRPVAVLTFEPLPQTWLRPEFAPSRLMSVRQKLECLANKGVDLVWLMRFNRALAEMGAERFVKYAVMQTLGAVDVVVGEDFHYGKGRAGNTQTLREAGIKSGFEVHAVETFEIDGVRVSSTTIREALAAGDFNRAKRFLGRPFAMQGRVIKGRRLGRQLGYPTANIRLATEPSPLQGVFAVRTRWPGSDWRGAVASLGTRPAVGGGEFLVEVHLFDFDGDLYGRRLEVEFVEKLRDEAHFSDMDDLVAQMREDERQARQCLRQ